MSDTEEGRNHLYIIPGNYEDSGGVFGGSFKLRNAIETIVICYTLFKIGSLVLAPFDIVIRIILFFAIVFPIGILCLIGIKGDSVTQFLMNVIMFHNKKRVLNYKILNTDDTYLVPPELQDTKKKTSIFNKLLKKESE